MQAKKTLPPANGFMMVTLINPAHPELFTGDLHPPEKNHTSGGRILRKICIFSDLIRAYNKCVLLLMQGAQSQYKYAQGPWFTKS